MKCEVSLRIRLKGTTTHQQGRRERVRTPVKIKFVRAS